MWFTYQMNFWEWKTFTLQNSAGHRTPAVCWEWSCWPVKWSLLVRPGLDTILAWLAHRQGPRKPKQSPSRRFDTAFPCQQRSKNVFGFFWNWDIVSCPCLTQSVLGWPSSRQHWHKLVDLVQLLTKPGELWISLSSPVDSPFGSNLKMFSNPVLVNCQLLTCISRLPTPATKVLHLVISLS